MAVWKIDRGEHALFEGTVRVATAYGATPTEYDLTGATLTFHMGSVMNVPMKSWLSGGSSLIISGGTLGVWTFEFQPEDTENLGAGSSYYWDLWLRTTTNKEYCVTVGTLNLKHVIGTI